MFKEIKTDKTLSFVWLSIGTRSLELVCVIRMSPLRELHGWRAPGISTHCSNGCVGLGVWACVSTSVHCSRYKPSIEFIQFVFLIWLCFSLLLFSLLAPFSPALITSMASSLSLAHLQTTAQQGHVSIAQEAAN